MKNNEQDAQGGMAAEEPGCILEPTGTTWEDEWVDIGGEG